jgi:beta-glucosidase/6-phospho-beta-glucosidase/beta-galactosidase
VFRSFFVGGFDCSEGLNASRQPIDHLAATQHDRFVGPDYRRLRRIGIKAAREGISWQRSVRGRHRFDFSSLEPILAAASCQEIDLIFDLFHFGYPEGLDPFGDEFAPRFADYSYAAAKFVAERVDGVPSFAPMNEPSYFAWAAGHAARFAPYCRDRAFDLKVALLRAAIQAVNGIWAAVPNARIISVDPVCRVVPPVARPDLQPEADAFNQGAVLEGWDMLAGRKLPELGGSRRHLGVVGINYYWTNQWELGSAETPLPDDDPRRVRLRDLATGVWSRYGGDLMITETGHINEHRARWLEDLADEILGILDHGVGLRGVCLYPVLGMPSWHDSLRHLKMGLWDLSAVGNRMRRKPCLPALAAFQKTRYRVEQRYSIDR